MAGTIAAWDPYVLDQECAAAWQMLRDLGVLDQDGGLTLAAVSAAEPMEMRILNPTLVKLLPQYGSDIEFLRNGVLVEIMPRAWHRPDFWERLADDAATREQFRLDVAQMYADEGMELPTGS